MDLQKLEEKPEMTVEMGKPEPEHILYRLPGYLLRRAANRWMTELSDRLAPLGLRISHASAMLLIGERRDMTSTEIGKYLDIKRANMAPLLGRLEALGFIERSPIDGKSQAVSLTVAGQKCLGDVQAITSKLERDLVAAIPVSHRDHLVPTLRALLDLRPE